MRSLRESVQLLDQVRNERLELEKQADALKEQEEQLRQEIIADMTAQGLKTTKFDDGIRVTVKNTQTYCVQDIEKLLVWQIKELIKCHKENRPLVDGLLFQQRLGQKNLDDRFENAYSPEVGASLGFVVKTRKDLSLTHTKKN